MGLRDRVGDTLGNAFVAFLNALGDIRQKVVEEGWTGKVQTAAQPLNTGFSEFEAWLYGRGNQSIEPARDVNPPGQTLETASPADDFSRWLERPDAAALSDDRDNPQLSDDDELGL